LENYDWTRVQGTQFRSIVQDMRNQLDTAEVML
jgi:hypothetical protein